MPWIVRCAEHPEFRGDHPSDAIAHADTYHGGEIVERLLDDGTIDVANVRQNIAQGNADQRIFGCRVCGERVITTDPERAPYCDDHLATGYRRGFCGLASERTR
jgi:rubrerythrin